MHQDAHPGPAGWPDRRIPDHDLVAETLAGSLESLDDAENYRTWILDLAAPYLDGSVLEVGAGHGTFTAELARSAPVTAVEPNPYAAQLIADRFAGDGRVTVVADTLDHVPADPRFGASVMINVLEHIADDLGTLRAIRARLRPGGHVVLWVPAFEVLYADYDRKLGHERRYRRRPLERLAEEAGFRVVDSRYANAPGWFSWLVLVKWLSIEPTSATTIRLFDRLFVPVVRALERWVRPPFGQSILLVARKPFADDVRNR